MALRKTPSADLKKKYQKTFESGIIISLVFVILSFKYFPEYKYEQNSATITQELVNVEDVILTKLEKQPPPPPKPPIPVEAPTDDLIDDVPIEPTEIDLKTPMPPPPPPPEENNENLPVIFRVVEEYPEPIGGIAAIQKKIVYPEIAKRLGVHGKVFVEVSIDENGNAFDAKIVKGIGAGCNEAALKAVLATKFKPGKQRGKPVKVRMTIPIAFRLK